jgi:hypothetical protein
MSKRGKALRYNKGKTRLELVPPGPLKALAEVYTKGAHKYSVYKDDSGKEIKGSEIPFEELETRNLQMISDGADNWKNGQNWKGVMASVKRHLAAWEEGEDFDPDPAMGTYHLANAAWGIFALLEFYKIFPQGDDRDHHYMKAPKIGLDIDEVLCDWVGNWTEMIGGHSERPTSWWFDRDLLERFEKMKKEDKLDEFYLSLQPLIKPEDIPFEPHCYITSRPVDTAVTERWLAKHGFPARPVFTTGVEGDKVAIAKREGVEVFVDDAWHNFKALNEAGITCFLMDAPHNRRYKVGYKRIKSLKELV